MLKRMVSTLKTRPHDERHAFAVLTAIVVMLILFVGWAITSLRGLQESSAPDPYQQSAEDTASSQSAAAASSVDSIVRSTVTSDVNNTSVPASPADTQTPNDGAQVDTSSYYDAPQASPVPVADPAKADSVAAQLQSALHP